MWIVTIQNSWKVSNTLVWNRVFEIYGVRNRVCNVRYGEKPWDGATTLHEMLNIPEEMEKYVSDYKMLLIEAR